MDDLKKRRRSVGSKADSAEKKRQSFRDLPPQLRLTDPFRCDVIYIVVKMSSENKYLQQQTDLLQTLRNEIRSLDSLIMQEGELCNLDVSPVRPASYCSDALRDFTLSEAKLSDSKRLSTKEGLAIKFSALSELAEKMTIVGELGMVSFSSALASPIDSSDPLLHLSFRPVADPRDPARHHSPWLRTISLYLFVAIRLLIRCRRLSC